ncbi:MarR family winged helix-turn-helix transcriptional regulator [Aureimonas sp. AU40]|uniref:MarR family winged helix-turn-helix transcriptional regulator n=1 Tax=Aureimonas sp. AU40 TaxID=1637747 RepID=UPI0007821136|nr:MarR family transcriptional regulator [Aureimonas sp. AU40]
MSFDCTCIVLRTAARKITALYDEALAPHGVTTAQYSLLRRIQQAGDPSLTELSRLADLDRSTVGRNVRLLAQMGLVSLDAGADQREAEVRLTALGLARIEACEAPWREAQRVVEAKVGSDGLAALKTLAASL